MTLQGKTILNLLAGAVAGVLAWALTDLTGWFSSLLGHQTAISEFDPRLMLYGAIFGVLLGLLLGIVDALSFDSPRQMAITLVAGAAIGFVGGGISASIAQGVYGLFVPRGAGTDALSPGLFFIQLISRAIGWAIMGTLIGAAQGVSRRSATIAWQGAFGGFFGGLLGGTVFQIIANILNDIPHIDVLSRLAALVATGALAGLFIGLAQNAFKQAWIRVMLGRNEGKEYLVAKPITSIGRSELADIGLFGDKNIAPTHCVIEAMPSQKRHRLRHVAGQSGGGIAYAPTVLNGQPITTEQWLADGDTIQIAQRTLQFQEKATRGKPRPVGLMPGAGQTARPESVPSAPPRAALTPSADILAQMGSAPTSPPALNNGGAGLSQATVLAAPLGAAAFSTGGIGTRLVAVSGPYTGQSFALSHLPVTIGRANEREISLSADSSVSRSHVQIRYENGRHLIMDAGSSNGTYVNGERLFGSEPLNVGSLIRLGETTLRYE